MTVGTHFSPLALKDLAAGLSLGLPLNVVLHDRSPLFSCEYAQEHPLPPIASCSGLGFILILWKSIASHFITQWRSLLMILLLLEVGDLFSLHGSLI